MRNLYRLIFRDRRRLTATVVLLFASWLVGSDTVPDVAFMPGELVTIIILTVASGVVAVAFPAYRFMVEVAGLSNFVFVGLGHLLPQSNFNLANPQGNIGSATLLYIFIVIVIHAILTGRWSDRLTPVRRRAHATAHSTLSARDLWYGLVPTPGHLDASPDPEVVSIDYADPSRRVIRLLNWLPPGRSSQILLHVEEVEPLNYIRLRIEGGDAGTLKGTTSFRIVDEGPRRRVEVCHVADALPLRRHLRGWLDDTLGRWMDLRLSRVERAARNFCETPGGVRYKRPTSSTATDLFNSVYAKDTPPDGAERRRTQAPVWITTLPKTER